MCSTHQNETSHHGHAHDSAALKLQVEDMTCGHCASTIKKAIEASIPGSQVNADPSSKVVSVTGTNDLAKLREIVTKAGYTPSAAPAGA